MPQVHREGLCDLGESISSGALGAASGSGLKGGLWGGESGRSEALEYLVLRFPFSFFSGCPGLQVVVHGL